MTPALAALLALGIYEEPLRPAAWAGIAAVLVGVTAAGWPAKRMAKAGEAWR